MNKRKKKTGFWLLLATAVALASCNSDADLPEKAAGQASGPTIIPYSVTAGGEQTRAALNESDQLIFQSGDQLAVTGENISGILTLAEGANERTAKFSGELTYTGSGDAPADDLELTATLTGSADTQTGIASTFADAFSKYSLMQGTSTYGEGVFHLEQQTSFVVFTVKFTDGTAANTVFNVSITHNSGTTVATGTTVTATVGTDIVAAFTLALPGGSKLTGSKATLTNSDDRHEVTFGRNSSEFEFDRNKYYTVKSTIGREAIDIGLHVGGAASGKKLLWANMNVGATTETESGSYFMWGDAVGHSGAANSDKIALDGLSFDWNHYKYAEGGNNHALTKYCNNSSYGYLEQTDSYTTLEPGDDGAGSWGGNWRMPTKAELEALYATMSNTTDYSWEWKTGYKGSTMDGYLITYHGNGNSIFLPLAGCRLYDNVWPGSYLGGNYWSSSLCTENPSTAWSLLFVKGGGQIGNDARASGNSIRPVMAEE